jgi:hypothetical protein
VRRQAPSAFEAREDVRGQAAAAGADFQDRSRRRSVPSTSAHWRATQAPNKAEISGAVVKSPPAPNLRRPAL